jgi:hypothetical protein
MVPSGSLTATCEGSTRLSYRCVLFAALWIWICASPIRSYARSHQEVEKEVVLVGRILDEDLAPVAGVELSIDVSYGAGGWGENQGSSLLTSSSGRFWFPLESGTPRGGFRYLGVRAHWRNEESVARLGRARAVADITASFERGITDLGDLVLVVPGSTKYISRIDDEALAQRYELMMRLPRWPMIESCLLEMARRGTKHWKEFLAGELARIRTEDDGGRHRSNDREVLYLTALRRAQGKPDPLSVLIDPEAELETVFPEFPILTCTLRNDDVDEESFMVSDGGSYRSGRFARCRLDVTGPDGRPVPALPRFGSMGGGVLFRRELEPGELVRFSIRLLDYAAFTSPGEHRIRILYHDEEDIADEESAAGRIVSSSPTFTLRLRAREERVTRVEAEEMRRWVGEIDASETISLVSGHWRPDLRFVEEVGGPEDRLFRRGFAAVPVLIGALEDERLEPERRAWIIAMLWNITGLHNPAGYENLGVLGSYRWIRDWPTSEENSGRTMAEAGNHQGEVIASRQEPFVARWQALRACFVLRVVD